jgi:hypothetical protein
VTSFFARPHGGFSPTTGDKMNAPLPEHIRKALETVTLDENPQGGFRRRHKYPGGADGCAGFGVELATHGVAA